MPACSDPASPAFVTFSGGFVASWMVVQRLLELEARGCRFTLECDGRFCVRPFELLTPDDVTFLRDHRDAARQVLEYSSQERIQ